MKNNKKVIVATDSKTMKSILVSILEENGYIVKTASDGLETLQLLYTDTPDCIIAYAYLPVLTGFSLSRIIKNTKQFSKTAVIICITEKSSVYQFWGDNACCNGLYVLGCDSPESICTMIDNAIQTVTEVEPKEKPVLQGKLPADNVSDPARILHLTVESYEKELFTHYVMAAAYEAGMKALSLDELIHRMVICLSGLCNYHALTVFVNDDTVIEYSDISSSIGKQDALDFRQVCKTDFISNATQYNDSWEIQKLSHSCIIEPEKNDTLKSYEFFVMGEKDFAGTIHIGSCKAEAFDERTYERMVFFTSIFSRLLELALHYRKTNRAEQRMRQAFSRFVPSEIIDNLIAGESSLGSTIGEKRKVAIMIVDIRNFTGISEINKPEDVVAFLNQYFTVMVNIIKSFGGSIDKFMGDAIMALFGATKSYEDNNDRATQAAIHMMQAIEKIETKEIIFPPGFKFNIGIGIHYGDVIVGSIGCEDKSDYTVIGDNVNLASRVESLTKQYKIPVIITGTVKDDLKGKFETRHLDNVKVKGKLLPVSIYELRTNSVPFPENFIDNYEKGFDLYQSGAWNLAIKYFNNALILNPEDFATKVLLERCLQYAVSSPANWDGAVALTTK